MYKFSLSVLTFLNYCLAFTQDQLFLCLSLEMTYEYGRFCRRTQKYIYWIHCRQIWVECSTNLFWNYTHTHSQEEMSTCKGLFEDVYMKAKLWIKVVQIVFEVIHCNLLLVVVQIKFPEIVISLSKYLTCVFICVYIYIYVTKVSRVVARLVNTCSLRDVTLDLLDSVKLALFILSLLWRWVKHPVQVTKYWQWWMTNNVLRVYLFSCRDKFYICCVIFW